MKTHKCDCDGRSLGLDKCDKCKSMNTETNHREFEEWASNQTWLSLYGQSGDAAWESWQAAREQLEKQLRIALDGHPDSQLWGGDGLLAATMRCVYGYEKLERERDEARRNRDNLIKLIEPFKYWRDISECDCSNPLPQGGCLRCDLERILSEILTSEKI